MCKWSWERLARQQAETFRRRANGHADIDFRIHEGVIDVILKTQWISVRMDNSFRFNEWYNVYEALRAMNEAYLFGFKEGLK